MGCTSLRHIVEKLEEPIISLVADPKANLIQPNVYGYDRIDIWCFNYDGQGTALITTDDDPEFTGLHRMDLDEILFGEPVDGVRWYRRERQTAKPQAIKQGRRTNRKG